MDDVRIARDAFGRLLARYPGGEYMHIDDILTEEERETLHEYLDLLARRRKRLG